MKGEEFRERFAVNEETGAYLLSSLGCMLRWNNSRRTWDNNSREYQRGYSPLIAAHDFDESHIPEEQLKAMNRSLKITRF